MSGRDVAEKGNPKNRRKLDEEKGAQPNLEAAFFHLASQGMNNAG
jgi:hypothetical protein